MASIIISGFAGTGKTMATEALKERGFDVVDLDSSNFSWLDEDKTERNPNFVEDYLGAIEELFDKSVDLIFISTHEEILKEVMGSDDMWKYLFVFYPYKSHRDNYIKKYLSRGDSSDFVNHMIDNFDKYVDSIDVASKQRPLRAEFIQIGDGEHILDFFSKPNTKPSFSYIDSIEGWDTLYDFITFEGKNLYDVLSVGTNSDYVSDLLWDMEQVFDEYGEKHRWAIERTVVFKRKDGKYLEMSYYEGATESQEDYGYSFRPVEKKTKTITVTIYD